MINRKQAAMNALMEMRSQLDALPDDQRKAVMAFIEELRKRAKDPMFDCAMKIAVVETEFGQHL